jgi:uncharacterized protein YqgV (UPF0045/DUF77 family)
MFTTVEGEWDEVMAVVKAATENPYGDDSLTLRTRVG